MKKISILVNIVSALFIIGGMVVSCDSTSDSLGLQFINKPLTGTTTPYDIIAYNLNNHDTIRTDAVRMDSVAIGAFNEPIFGGQKTSYVTQMRLGTYNPDFGTNAVVDSVVLQIKPSYNASKVTTTTTTINKVPSDVDSTKTVNTYPVYKYGNVTVSGATPSLTIKVQEVNDFLYGRDKIYFSNSNVGVSTLLGTKTFKGNVSSVTYTNSANNSNIAGPSTAAINIPLDKNYFQSKIIAMKGQYQLNDVASFIRYIKGLKISVDENDGYFFKFLPDAVSLTMYYKNDLVSGTTTTRQSQTYSFDLSSSNVHLAQTQFTRPSGFLSSINTSTGDDKLYLQGMGGPGAEIKIPDATISSLQNLYSNNKIGIVSAKLRFYTDNSWSTAFPKPTNFTVLQKGVDGFLSDMSTLIYGSSFSQLVSGTNLSQSIGYYDIGVTQTVKDIIEKGALNLPIDINVGRFNYTSGSTTLAGYQYTSRTYAPNRVVLVGSNTTNTQYKAQLLITYAKQ